MMNQFIQLLLANHPLATQQAIDLFQMANQSIQQRLEAGRKNQAYGGDELADALEPLLIEQLSRYNLTDPTTYRKMNDAIYSWSPSGLAHPEQQMQECGFIQNILLSLLIPLRRKQCLDKECKAYQLYLEGEIRKQNPNLLLSPDQKTVTPEISRQYSINGLKSHSSVVVKSLSQPGIKKDFPVLLALEKHRAVVQIRQTLRTTKNTSDQWQDFRCSFDKHKSLLSLNRDAPTVKFMKNVINVLSLGLTWLCGFWRSEGSRSVEKIETALQTAPIVR